MQFPQPTRPIGSFDANSDSFLHDSQNSYQFIDSNISQLSQQPPPGYPTTIDSEYSNAENNVPEDILHFQFYDDTYPAAPKEGEQEEKDNIVQKLSNVLSDWYKKLPEGIRRQINAKKLNENVTIPRGSAPGIQIKELSDKLERFKVRIVNQDNQDQNTK